jgi:uncharacterized protein (DUF924 family)
MFPYQDIMKFWFQGITPETPLSSKIPIVKLWFNSDADFDARVRSNFFVLFQDSVISSIVQGADSPEERLGKIICFDQFPRNIFRTTPMMFNFDHVALNFALEGLEKKEHLKLRLYERIFFYMPLMHAEDLKVQERSVELFEELAEEAKKSAKHSSSYYASNLKYAREHCDVIKTFGRFPYRNEVLNRKSSPEEIKFLKK